MRSFIAKFLKRLAFAIKRKKRWKPARTYSPLPLEFVETGILAREICRRNDGAVVAYGRENGEVVCFFNANDYADEVLDGAAQCISYLRDSES